MSLAELTSLLANLPLSLEGRFLLSALIISIAIAFVALLRNRQDLIGDVQETSNEIGAIFENPSSLLPHLVELRDRIVRSFIAIAVGALVASVLTESILVVFAEPIGGLQNLTIIRVTEGISVFFRVTIVVGIVLASPYVIAQLWIFVGAGLKPSERRVFYWLFPFAILLFISGVAFAYFVMLPVAVPFLVEFLGLNARPTLDDYFSFVTTVMLWVGLSFEMPLIVFVLARLRLVSAKILLDNWRIALVGIAILAAVITPTPDPINMGIVAAPLIALYFLSVILAGFANPNPQNDEEPL